MEEEPPSLPDNASVDPPQPPPSLNFPKPDFTEIVQDLPDTPTSDKSEVPLFKPTFKNVLQAKKRLQAFSSARAGSLPSSPKKNKLIPPGEEKSDEATSPVKKLSKKGSTHDDKARAVIEEIEEMKREEMEILELKKLAFKRSRSRTPDKGRFKKVDKKSRNYRRRPISPKRTRERSPRKPRESPKKAKKYPRNWREFYESNADFDVNRTFDIPTPTGNNELLRQSFFESPSLPIVPFKMKTVNREDKVVPFQYVRYTRTKPLIPYSVNFCAIKEIYLTRKALMDSLPKVNVANLETLYSNSVKFAINENDPKEKKSRAWYPKNWKEKESESSKMKILEKSVGLSFLQTYSGEEEEADIVEVEEEIRPEVKKKIEEVKEEKSKAKDEPLEKEVEGEVKKKKKKVKKDEAEAVAVDKKKKKKHKEKKKHADENLAEKSPKKKMRESKDKAKKKEKRTKEKKHKRKKAKEKKKKSKEKPQAEQKPVEKLTKEQVIEELKEIEEKLAKKREEEKQKKDKEEKTRKRKHSDRDEEVKHEKHRRTSEENHADHALKRKLEKTKKLEKEKSEKHEEEKKPRRTEEVVRKRKSRWSDDVQIKEEFSDFDEVKIIAEIAQQNEEEEDYDDDDDFKANTPDTDEYHSHWESDDDVSSSAPRNSLKINRSWESDEELFERSHNRDPKPSESYANLEIPLNIKTVSRRSANWDVKVIEELKMLEEERRSLSEERKKLEVEKQKIIKLKEEAKVEKKAEETAILPEVKVKKEINDFSIDSLNNSLLSTVSSTESNFPIGLLENQYEEFIKAVSSESSNASKKKPEESTTDSSTSSSWSSDSDHRKRKRRSKSKKKKRRKSKRDCDGLLLGKGNEFFNEFDIPVPSDIPEMVPTPVPVPSPLLPIIDNILPLKAPPLLLNPSLIEQPPPPPVQEVQPIEDGLDLTKPFVFSSIVLPTKKTPLVDNSNLKLDDDSDSTDFTDKFVKKPEIKEDENEEKEEEITAEEFKQVEAEEAKEVEVETVTEETTAKQPPEKVEPTVERIKPDVVPVIDDISSVPLPPEKAVPKETPPPQISPAKRSSRSISPRKSVDRKDKRRSRSRSPPKRRSPIRRRDPTPPPRRRHASPRRRSPPRRRGSPHRRTPSPRRRSLSPRRRSSPSRRRRRTPSLSPPPRSRGGARKRTPSPRRRTSPLNSPLDGFKRSVADSTISDDMLPQRTPDDYNDSPNSYGGVPKYFKSTNKRGSLSPPIMSPRRVSLDERISQVLGLEKEGPPPPPPKPQETFQNYAQNYNTSFGQQYNQYGQYIQSAPTPFGPMMYTQPPPPIAKPPQPPTKVLQVGNILQVVPTEDMPPPVIETKIPEMTQKIVQVGNMLQIVPAAMPPPRPTIVEPPATPPQPVAKPVVHIMPEKQSAEALMKQKTAERKAEREKRRQERERRRKDKEKKRKEKEKRKQTKLKVKTENMIKRAIQIETEALANDDVEEESENADAPAQWPPVPVVISTTPTGKGILSQGGSKQRKSVQFADGVRPGEGTSPSGGEELSSPPPRKLPKEKRYKKIKIPKKSKKKKVRVKVVRRPPVEEEEDDEEEENLPPPSPPPGSPPPHVFPSRVKTHTINNVHQYVGNILQSAAGGFPFRPPMPPPVVMNRHQPPPGYMPGAYPQDVNNLTHPSYQGVPSHH